MKNWKITLLIGVLVALASELYWDIFTAGFRISTAVILLPILLMTLGKRVSTRKVCAVTACIILLFRTVLTSGGLTDMTDMFLLLIPNAAFYLCYGILFSVMIPNKHTASWKNIAPALFFSDFLSNMLELFIFEIRLPDSFSLSMAGTLALIAVFRTMFAVLFLAAIDQYGKLLKNEEHENRYRRLFLMTTGLKNEIYFMKKNSEEIEAVMGNAYQLYEKLSEMDVPEDMKRMSLSIARDVHEIKKDYIRIIQGIEQEISEEYDEKRMSFRDLLKILEQTTYHLLEAKDVRIELDFCCTDDFITKEHYELMAVLKNIVNNAIEAIESDSRQGVIRLEEQLRNGHYEFTITDNGPGITVRHLPNIFKMGYSTKFDYKTGNIYRGVGLYGVKATVEEIFEGTIDVTSEPGKGTSFLIRIPAETLEER